MTCATLEVQCCLAAREESCNRHLILTGNNIDPSLCDKQPAFFLSFLRLATTQHPPKTEKLKPAASTVQKPFLLLCNILFISISLFLSVSKSHETTEFHFQFQNDSTWMCTTERERVQFMHIYLCKDPRSDGGGFLFPPSAIVEEFVCRLNKFAYICEIQFGAPNAFWLPQKWALSLECLSPYFILVSHLMEIGADSTSLCRRERELERRKTFCCFSCENSLSNRGERGRRNEN